MEISLSYTEIDIEMHIKTWGNIFKKRIDMMQKKMENT